MERNVFVINMNVREASLIFPTTLAVVVVVVVVFVATRAKEESLIVITKSKKVKTCVLVSGVTFINDISIYIGVR